MAHSNKEGIKKETRSFLSTGSLGDLSVSCLFELLSKVSNQVMIP